MRTLLCVAILAGGVVATDAYAHVVLPEPVRSESIARCPGGAEWLRMRDEEQRRMAQRRGAPATNPGLQEVLIALDRESELSAENAAQAAADAAATAADAAATAIAAMQDGAAPASPGAKKLPSPNEVERIGRLQRIVELNGVPTVDEVGDRGMSAFVSALRSIDAGPEFRIRVAGELLGQRELDRWLKRSLAELVDNILDQHGKPQRYGTLFSRDEQDRAVFARPIENEAGLNARRIAAGLPASALELCARRDGGGDF